MKAFVTGSTGLLGSNLVSLLLAQGFEVKALARSEEKARRILTDPRIEIVIGDMEDVAGFAKALAGCDVLFHTAAYFREYFNVGEHWKLLEKINVHGTIQLLEAAEKAGVKKAIYVSSSGVIGNNPDGRPGDETTPPGKISYQNLYFKSKVLAEEAVARFLKTHALPVVLILPTVMLGPQDAGPTGGGRVVVGILNRQFPIVLPGGFDFVDARDVAQAMINAVEQGKSGERYLITHGYHTFQELAAAIEKASGIPVPRRVAPYPMMMMIARLSEMQAKLTGRDAQLTTSAVDSFVAFTPVTAAKAKRELGVTFRPFEESIRDEVNWFIANGYVRQKAAQV